jgi:hypothetical protein
MDCSSFGFGGIAYHANSPRNHPHQFIAGHADVGGRLDPRRAPGQSRNGRRAAAQHGYSLQANRNLDEGSDHPDRDAQFRFINEEVRKALAARRPVISVDTKKKELLGNCVNAGRQWRKAGTPERVQVHDFPSPTVPRAYPYGIYDLTQNTGFVNVGTDHDTGAFAIASTRWVSAPSRHQATSLANCSICLTVSRFSESTTATITSSRPAR